MRSMVEGAIPRAGARPCPSTACRRSPSPAARMRNPGLLRAASLHGSRRAYAILPGRSRRGRGTMRSMVEGAIPRAVLGPCPLHRLSAVPLPRLTRVRNPGLLRAASLHRDPPPSLATGKGDHAQHGGGGNPTRRRSALPPPPPIGGPPPSAHEGEESGLATGRLAPPRSSPSLATGRGTMRSMVEGAIPRAGARPLPPPPPIGGPPPPLRG